MLPTFLSTDNLGTLSLQFCRNCPNRWPAHRKARLSKRLGLYCCPQRLHTQNVFFFQVVLLPGYNCNYRANSRDKCFCACASVSHGAKASITITKNGIEDYFATITIIFTWICSPLHIIYGKLCGPFTYSQENYIRPPSPHLSQKAFLRERGRGCIFWTPLLQEFYTPPPSFIRPPPLELEGKELGP